MMAGGVMLEIDASELEAEIERLRSVMTPQQFSQAMWGIFQRTGGHVRGILKKDLPQQYNIKAGEVGKAVGRAELTGSPNGINGVGCIIPVKGPRRSIGVGFPASGGARGWESLHKRYRVKARIVKSGESTLPAQMSSGQAPFRNLGPKRKGTGWYNQSMKEIKGAIGYDGEWSTNPKSSLGKLTFAREGKARLKIKKVVGIAIPQMPTNRSEAAVQRDIKDYMEDRIEARFQALIKNGR